MIVSKELTESHYTTCDLVDLAPGGPRPGQPVAAMLVDGELKYLKQWGGNFETAEDQTSLLALTLMIEMTDSALGYWQNFMKYLLKLEKETKEIDNVR